MEEFTMTYSLLVRYGHGHDVYIKEIKGTERDAFKQAEEYLQSLSLSELNKISRCQLMPENGGFKRAVLYRY